MKYIMLTGGYQSDDNGMFFSTIIVKIKEEVDVTKELIDDVLRDETWSNYKGMSGIAFLSEYEYQFLKKEYVVKEIEPK